SRIEGNLEIEGEVKLQGQISGKVVGTGLVTIGEQANVRANVHAPAVIVEGVVRGEIHAKERIELHRTAKVQGLISAPRLRIDEGALFEGECRMSPGEAKAEPARLEERRAAAVAAPVAAAAQAAAPKNLAQR
ncbi:MAG: bactofilin family protein, partial [Candidatus Binatia bacterium]